MYSFSFLEGLPTVDLFWLCRHTAQFSSTTSRKQIRNRENYLQNRLPLLLIKFTLSPHKTVIEINANSTPTYIFKCNFDDHQLCSSLSDMQHTPYQLSYIKCPTYRQYISHQHVENCRLPGTTVSNGT